MISLNKLTYTVEIVWTEKDFYIPRIYFNYNNIQLGATLKAEHVFDIGVSLIQWKAEIYQNRKGFLKYP